MGMVGENAQALKKDLTWTPLPSVETIKREASKKGELSKDEVAGMATDLMQTTPIGAVAGIIKKIKPSFELKGFSQEELEKFYNKLGDVYDEFTNPTDAFKAALEQANRKEAAVLRALQKDDLLGFDYPHQAMRGLLEDPSAWDLSPNLKGQLTKLGSTTEQVTQKTKPTQVPSFPVRGADDFFGMHKSTELGDIVLTRSAKDPSKYQMTFFDGKLGQSASTRDVQYDTLEEAKKAFEDLK